MSNGEIKQKSWLYAVFILLLFAALYPTQILTGVLAGRLQDSGHIILGAVAAILFSGIGRIQNSKHNLFWAWIVTVIFLLIIEIVQMQLHRDASWIDLLVGASGAAAIFLILSSVKQSSSFWRWCYRLVGTIILLLALSPLLFTSTAYIVRNIKFPVLADFSSITGNEFLQTHSGELIRQQDVVINNEKFLARLCLNPGDWPGISIDEVVPDWSGYDKLSMVLFSDLAFPVEFVLRVHDRRHNHQLDDRYNFKFNLPAGFKRIKIALDDIKYAPVGRDMDMRSIQGIVLFSTKLDEPICVNLGSIQLLP
jgi:hypothetical protein